MRTKEKITVALVNDDDFFRRGLKSVLKKFADIEIIGEATNPAQVDQLVVDKHPGIILIDVNMNGCDGIATVRKILKEHLDTNIIAFSHDKEESHALNILEAGIAGYLLKDVSANELYHAIEEVKNGNTYYCKQISNKIFKSISCNGNGLKRQQPVFTDVEQKIIQSICLEETSKEISAKLCLSIRTIEGHRHHIIRKMGVKSSVGIALYAIQRGMFKIADSK
jgi:DNA-binding NarL/FixJ family response regulator